MKNCSKAINQIREILLKEGVNDNKIICNKTTIQIKYSTLGSGFNFKSNLFKHINPKIYIFSDEMFFEVR